MQFINLLTTRLLCYCTRHKRVNRQIRYYNFHSLEVVDRVSETQLQVGENSNCINLIKTLDTCYCIDTGEHLVAVFTPLLFLF